MNKSETPNHVFSKAEPASVGGRLLSRDDTLELLSALADGELSDEQVTDLLAMGDHDSELGANWASYHVIGDALRGQTEALCVTDANQLLAAVRTEMAISRVEESAEAKRLAPADLDRVVAPIHVPSANDANFRWKMTAAVASVAAVVAVGWNAISFAPEPASSRTPTMVMADKLLAPSAEDGGAPVLVKTEIGAMIRDPELERLLSEHRSYGSASSLQMPAGFLRSATQEASRQP